METIKVNDIEVSIVKKDIKNIHLGVYPPNGNVRVACPVKTNDEAIRLLIVSKYTWIKKHISNFLSQSRETSKEYVSGESHYLLGKRYILNIVHQDKSPNVILRNKKYLDMYVQEDASTEKKREVMYKFYHDQFRELLTSMTGSIENKTGLKPLEYRVRSMKTKWGSCNIQTKRIWLNIELIKRDKKHIEYVITHELVHLLERGHTEVFKSHMDRHIPNWREIKEELKLGILGC